MDVFWNVSFWNLNCGRCWLQTRPRKSQSKIKHTGHIVTFMKANLSMRWEKLCPDNSNTSPKWLWNNYSTSLIQILHMYMCLTVDTFSHHIADTHLKGKFLRKSSQSWNNNIKEEKLAALHKACFSLPLVSRCCPDDWPQECWGHMIQMELPQTLWPKDGKNNRATSPALL